MVEEPSTEELRGSLTRTTEAVVVKADVKGNLGPPSVVTQAMPVSVPRETRQHASPCLEATLSHDMAMFGAPTCQLTLFLSLSLSLSHVHSFLP